MVQKTFQRCDIPTSRRHGGKTIKGSTYSNFERGKGGGGGGGGAGGRKIINDARV